MSKRKSVTLQPVKSLFVTVGSTLFPLLTNKILSRTILEILVSLGVTSLTVQYGRGDLPKDFETYVSLIDQHGSQDPGRLVCIYGEELQIEVFRFTNDFDRYVEVSEAIISHAGSGSILSALRKRPPIPLLVVANTSLMDNHQSELADALESQGYLSVSSPEDLEEKLPMILKRGPMKRFPDLDPSLFRGILDETMGFNA